MTTVHCMYNSIGREILTNIEQRHTITWHDPFWHFSFIYLIWLTPNTDPSVRLFPGRELQRVRKQLSGSRWHLWQTQSFCHGTNPSPSGLDSFTFWEDTPMPVLSHSQQGMPSSRREGS